MDFVFLTKDVFLTTRGLFFGIKNYLSLNFPNGLLYACLVEAYGFLKGPQDLLQLYEQKYTQVVKGFSIEQMGRRRRDEYESGVPRIGKQ